MVVGEDKWDTKRRKATEAPMVTAAPKARSRLVVDVSRGEEARVWRRRVGRESLEEEEDNAVPGVKDDWDCGILKRVARY